MGDNVLDSWNRVKIDKADLMLNNPFMVVFPHEAWANSYNPDYIPTKEQIHNNLSKDGIKTKNGAFVYENIYECCYYSLEDWLSFNCSKHWLLLSEDTHLNIYFQKKKDAVLFKLTWC